MNILQIEAGILTQDQRQQLEENNVIVIEGDKFEYNWISPPIDIHNSDILSSALKALLIASTQVKSSFADTIVKSTLDHLKQP